MTREQIIEMLKELVNEIDYDICKEYFEFDEVDPDPLVKIVEKHIMKIR